MRSAPARTRSRRPAAFACALAVSVVLGALAAQAAIPPGPRLLEAVAKRNQVAKRGSALQLRVALVREDAPPDSSPVATGVLLSDALGRARLELTLAGGGTERHVRRGGEYRMTRDGEPARPRPRLVPPLGLLLGTTGTSLDAALTHLGADTGQAVLGRSHGHDCFVVGGRDPLSEGGPARRSALWIEVDSYAVVRIDLADGVRYRLGPEKRFGTIGFPAWVSVESRGAPPLRLRVDGVSRGEAAPASFEDAWLLER